MSRAQITRTAQGAANVNCPNAAETIVTTLAGVSLQGADTTVQLKGWAQVTTGVGATGITLAIRRGTTVAGALVGTATAQFATASQTDDWDVQLNDAPGELAGGGYVLTVIVTGGAAAGTAVQSSLAATF